MIKLEVKPICSGPAGGKSATVVWQDDVQLGFIQVVSVDNSIGGGPCYPNLYVAVQTIYPYEKKLYDTFESALGAFGIMYPQTNAIEYPAGIFDEYQQHYHLWHDSLIK